MKNDVSRVAHYLNAATIFSKYFTTGKRKNAMSLAFYRELFIELMTNHIFPTTTMKAQGKKKQAHNKISICRELRGRLTAKFDFVVSVEAGSQQNWIWQCIFFSQRIHTFFTKLLMEKTL
jgi:hypothetical protein